MKNGPKQDLVQNRSWVDTTVAAAAAASARAGEERSAEEEKREVVRRAIPALCGCYARFILLLRSYSCVIPLLFSCYCSPASYFPVRYGWFIQLSRSIRATRQIAARALS